MTIKDLYKNARILTLVSLSSLLGACAIPNWVPFTGQNSGVDLAPQDTALLRFFTSDSNFDSGISLRSGARYQLKMSLVSNWIDSYIDANESGDPLDEKGFDDSLMPFQFLSLLKRSRQHRWFELMLYQPACERASKQGVSDLLYDDENNSYEFVANCDGKLKLFVNDSHGAYSNNVGYASILLSRIN